MLIQNCLLNHNINKRDRLKLSLNWHSNLNQVNPTNIKTLAFSGNKNPKQVAIIALEGDPIVKHGGVADVIGNLPKELNGFGLDTRVFLPLYNAKESLKEVNGRISFTNKNNVSFNLEKTDIKVQFNYGMKQEEATLYKVNDPKVAYKAYLVLCPNTISNQKEEYQGELSQQTSNNTAFCTACVKIMQSMKDSPESFNPKFLNTNDWGTAFVFNNPELVDDFEDVDNIKKVHTFHNAGFHYQGRIPAIVAAVNLFPKSENEDKLSGDNAVRQQIQQINGTVKKTIEKLQTLLLDDEIARGNYGQALVKIANGHEQYSKYVGKDVLGLNQIVVDKFPYEAWTSGEYNPSLKALGGSNFITTVSREYLDEAKQPGQSAPELDNEFRRATWKSTGVTNGLDLENFDPTKQNPDTAKQIKQLYSSDSFEEGKKANKQCFWQNKSLANGS